MIFGFHDYGITMNGTGGGYIHNSWLGQFAPGASAGVSSATAIALQGSEHDCYVTSVIIWSGKTGVISQNGANQISGVHTWNLATNLGGVGIKLVKGNGKVIDSYLDFCPLVIVDPHSAVVANNLFLARHVLVQPAVFI